MLAVHFQSDHEYSAGCLRLFRSLVESAGVPWAIYRDQHGTLQRNDKNWSLEEELAGRQFPTQAGRALEELGIAVIVARSTQAKGQIERTWRTFQDRLNSELRLAKASHLEQAANVLTAFLAGYNERFGKAAARPAPVWRKLDSRLDLPLRFQSPVRACCQQRSRHHRHSGRHHSTAAFAQRARLRAEEVEVCHQPGGDFHVYLDRRLLHIQPPAADAGPVRAHDLRKSKAPYKKKPLRVYQYSGRPATRA